MNINNVYYIVCILYNIYYMFAVIGADTASACAARRRFSFVAARRRLSLSISEGKKIANFRHNRRAGPGRAGPDRAGPGGRPGRGRRGCRG